MSRFLLAGLFVLSLTICAGCGGDSGPAVAPDKDDLNKSKANISGMGDDKGEEGGAGKLPPPPPLPPIPPGNQ